MPPVGWQAIQILRNNAKIAVMEVWLCCVRRGRPSRLCLLSASQFFCAKQTLHRRRHCATTNGFCLYDFLTKSRNASFKFNFSLSLPWISKIASYKYEWALLRDTSSGTINVLNSWRLRYSWPRDTPSLLVCLFRYVQIFSYHTVVGNHKHTRASGGHFATIKVVVICVFMWSAPNFPGRMV